MSLRLVRVPPAPSHDARIRNNVPGLVEKGSGVAEVFDPGKTFEEPTPSSVKSIGSFTASARGSANPPLGCILPPVSCVTVVSPPESGTQGWCEKADVQSDFANDCH